MAFNGYYKTAARENYLIKALNGSKVDKWKIIPRINPATDFPSDFDVISLEEENSSSGLEAIRNHPSVKSVTPQRIVYRSLKLIDEPAEYDSSADVEEDELIYQNDDRQNNTEDEFSHFRRGLAASTTNDEGNVNNTKVQAQQNRHTNRRLLRAIPRQVTSILKADILWKMGITGKGIKVAVFDTGRINFY